jgi:Flp pilus assembly protein TadD
MKTEILRRWPLPTIAGGLLIALSACAPNSARVPLPSGADAALMQAEQESSRYGTMLRLASSTRAAGDSAAAVNIYQQAIAYEGNRPEAYTLLGDTLIELEAFDQAIETFEDALERQPNSVAAHRGYARALVAMRRPEAAITHYQRALKLAPNDVQIHNGLAVAQDLAGQHQEAQETYRDALAIAPESMLLRNNLGLSLALSGQFEDAISLLQQVADEPAARARNRQNLALAYGLAGDLAAAERLSRIDLDDEAVENNMAYFAALAAIDDRRKRAAALGAHPSDGGNHGADPAGAKQLAALAVEGQGLELGLAPTGRWFVNLGDYADRRTASAAWRQMRSRHQDLLAGFGRLAGSQDGGQPLLAGPLASAESAESLCAQLMARGQTCRALAL